MNNKEPINFYNSCFKVCCKVACKIFNATYTATDDFNEQISSGKGMIIFCNHLSSLDFLFTSQSILNNDVACVVADNMKFSNKFLSNSIKHLKTIYKKQYYPDFACVKEIKKCIDNGTSVVLCPEGKVSSEGITSKITQTTGKLVKLLKCPVGIIVVKGTGLTRPKWAYSTRYGKIESNAKMLLNSDEISILSVEEINNLIQENLANNEYDFQKNNGIKFKGRRYAEGLERVLYKCPKCGAEFEMSTKGDILKCDHCGNTVKYLKNGELVPLNNSFSFSNIEEWVEYEKAKIREDIDNNKIEQEYKVWMFIGNEKSASYDYIADGKLSYDGDYIRFRSNSDFIEDHVKLNFNVSYMTSKIKHLIEPIAIDERYKRMDFNVKHIPSIANIPGDTIDLINEYGTFRFMFYDKYASTKLTYTIEEYNKK